MKKDADRTLFLIKYAINQVVEKRKDLIGLSEEDIKSQVDYDLGVLHTALAFAEYIKECEK